MMVRAPSRRSVTGVIAALGVVYGDIGTSPLYAFRLCFDPARGVPVTEAHVLGVLSLIFWSLVLVVGWKYLYMILRADNHGEGGIMALLALVSPKLARPDFTQAGIQTKILVMTGILGTAFLFGDGVITPAISVLSAVEGLRIATPALEPYIVPVTVVILLALFLMQHNGTARIGSVFGPVILLWFGMISAMGIPWIIRHPEVLHALNPVHAVRFAFDMGATMILVLGGVVLCVTGVEALYLDLGHFGKRPIRLGWFLFAFPALTINYLGQGALLLERGDAALANTFFAMVSGPLLYPVVAIATAATVIASQAVISGAFSLTQQAVQLGYLPRTDIMHTSHEKEGQIFVPLTNVWLMLACVALVIGFGASERLAAAYGIAVTGAMATTSILFMAVARKNWGWRLWLVAALGVSYLTIDLAFFSANVPKLLHGGWFPLAVAVCFVGLMTTWKKGREILAKAMMEKTVPLGDFIVQAVGKGSVPRLPGTAVFMTLARDVAPSVLIHHFEHYGLVHEKVILLSVLTKNDPEVPKADRVKVADLGSGFFKVLAYYGYMQSPDSMEVLEAVRAAGVDLGPKNPNFFIGRETLIPTGDSGMALWRKKLLVFLARNSRSASQYFNIPPPWVVEVGNQRAI